MMNKPRPGGVTRRSQAKKHQKRRGLKKMPATQFAVTEKQKDASTPVIKVNTVITGAHHTANGFESELIRRCREKGMSDGEIRAWMEET